MTEPAVSIIVPAYRAGRFLPELGERLSSLSFRDFEVIVVDDGSGDDTADAARRLAETHSNVRALVLPDNVGVARARQHATGHARGTYVWYVDVDDAWPTTALDTLTTVAGHTDADIIVAGAMFVYSSGERRPLPSPGCSPVDGTTAFQMLLRGEITGHLWNKLIRRSVALQMSFTPARVQSDLIMVADALCAAERVAFTQTVVYDYRLRDGSIITSTSRRAESLALIAEAVAAHAARLDLGDTDDYRYFVARYIRLSGIKDALLAGYDHAHRAELLRSTRRALSMSDLLVFARRRDARRLALAATAKASIRAHRALLRLAER